MKRTFTTSIDFMGGDYTVTYAAYTGRAATLTEPEEDGEIEVIKVLTEPDSRDVTDQYYRLGFNDKIAEQIEESGDPGEQWEAEDCARGDYENERMRERYAGE